MFPLIGLLLIACAGQRPTGACGESFCLPADGRLLGKQTPVEDFNLYQVEWRGTRFGIYEGNHPQRSDGGHRTPLRLPVDEAASISRVNGGGSIIVNVGKDWPAYLDVMGPCQSPQHCPLESFAAELTLR